MYGKKCITKTKYEMMTNLLAFLLFMYAEISCFVIVFSSFYIYLELFWNTIRAIATKKLFFQYMEFWINQLRKNTEVYCIQTVCKMVQGISRKKNQSLSLLVLQLSLGKNLILLIFLDSNIHKHENFKLTVLHGHMFYYTLTFCW